MTGEEFKDIRMRLGLSGLEMGRALGYQGKSKSVRVLIRRYEAKDEASTVHEIPPWIVRLAWMYGKYGVAPQPSP